MNEPFNANELAGANALSGEDGVWCDGELEVRFAALTALLSRGRQFWRHHAFQYLQLPWESEFPQLSQRLRALPYEDAEQLARDDEALTDFLRTSLPMIAELTGACAVGGFDAPPPAEAEPRDVPGRKWQQIRHFAPCVPENNLALLEWCAGKAHLGRQLAAQRGSSVIALDRDAALIEAGRAQAARANIAIDFRCVDVMSAAAAAAIRPEHNAIALHACGDLHMRLLTLCAQTKTRTITLAPCCYQLIADESRCVLSQAARASGLQLRRDDLRTAVHGTVTASARQNRQRRQLQAWRLGFDLLQRELRGIDAYLPTPPLSTTILKTGFADFCAKLALHRRLRLPDRVDYLRYERAGAERLREASALDLPRIAHRRALELWLALDRALYLRERGYTVALGVFCARELTPRNLCIRAALSG